MGRVARDGVAGVGSGCCWYQWDGESGQRGCPVEPSRKDADGNTIRRAAPAVPGPVWSGATRRPAPTCSSWCVWSTSRWNACGSFSDDCPLDAGGRTVYWLDGVTAADSVAYLQSLIALGEKSGPAERPVQTPHDSRDFGAIGMHRDASVDSLIALARQNQDRSARSSAFTWLGRSRDPKAVAFIDGILKR